MPHSMLCVQRKNTNGIISFIVFFWFFCPQCSPSEPSLATVLVFRSRLSRSTDFSAGAQTRATGCSLRRISALTLCSHANRSNYGSSGVSPALYFRLMAQHTHARIHVFFYTYFYIYIYINIYSIVYSFYCRPAYCARYIRL